MQTLAAAMSTENIATYTHELPAEGRKRMLTYAVFGLPLASRGTPEQYIIYHHGWPSCRLEALPLHDVAANLSWRVLAVDRPGVGGSTYHHQATFEQWAKDIEHLLNAQGIQKAIMGSVVVGRLHVRVPATSPTAQLHWSPLHLCWRRMIERTNTSQHACTGLTA